jgi:NADH dehydrogenase
LNLVVVGGGPTGVEVSGAMAELVGEVLGPDFHDLDVHRATVTLVEMTDHLLGPFDDASRRYARDELEQRGVDVRTGTQVAQVTPEQVVIADGEAIRSRCVVWAAGVRANPWRRHSTFPPAPVEGSPWPKTCRWPVARRPS